MSVCDRLRPSLAAHAFGALEDPERTEIERHLGSCEKCRAEFRELARLPELLSLAGGTDVTIPSPPPLLEASVLARVTEPVDRGARPRPRRRRRWRTGGALSLSAALGAACALAIAALVGPRPSVSGSMRLTLRPTARAPSARAVALLTQRPWGPQIELRADYLASTAQGQLYEVWLVSPHGRLSAGTFTADRRHPHIRVTLAAGAHPGQFVSIGVTLQPDREDPRRRGPQVLGARLPS